MCRNWQEGDDVVVNYPRSGTSRYGTIINSSGHGHWCVLYYQDQDSTQAEEADPYVQESWMEVPGAHAQMTSTGCDQKELL
jgi:hypothetical protein